MAKERLIQCYKRAERINHWIVAACFVLLAISGLAFFYPAFFWLTGVFGTPQLARILHPIIGVVMFIGFFVQFLRYWKYSRRSENSVQGDNVCRVRKYIRTLQRCHDFSIRRLIEGVQTGVLHGARGESCGKCSACRKLFLF